MQSTSKTKSQNSKVKPYKFSVSRNAKDYEDDPYFRKKDEEARKFLEKHGFPEDVIKRFK